MKEINWKVRIKNKVFWIALIPAVLILIETASSLFGLSLDFSGLEFMDSSGIAVLLRAHRQMCRLEGELRVVNVPPQAKRVFQAAGLSRVIRFE